jgi:hypothetical protein
LLSYDRLPAHMREGARLYVERGIEPGGFLFAVLSNDLLGAYERADDVNTFAMRAWAAWLHDECPLGAQGSPEKVRAWIGRGGMLGMVADRDGRSA